MSRKSILGIFAIIGLTTVTGLSLFLSNSSRLSQKNTINSKASEMAFASNNSYADIKGMTFYEVSYNRPDKDLDLLMEMIPYMKATGVNTVWFVLPWTVYNPKPLENPPIYNDVEFAKLRQVLDLLRNNNMRAILPLNYFGTGWQPEGIDICVFLNNATMYGAFETYVGEFMRRIEDYNDMVYLMVFTEGTEGSSYLNCNDRPYDAKKHIQELKSTLGSMPTRLPPDLRSKFRIGYHDYTLINMNWAEGLSPIQDPISFDFLSMVGYETYGGPTVNDPDGDWTTKEGIRTELLRRINRFKTMYPNTPLIMGESGGSSCRAYQYAGEFVFQATEDTQDLIYTTLAEVTREQNVGMVFWGIKEPQGAVCPKGEYDIYFSDGRPKKSALSLQRLFNAPIGVTPSIIPVTPISFPTPTEVPGMYGYFKDVPVNHWAYKAIETIRLRGITTGCRTNPPYFCPAEQVTRDAAAVFIGRAMKLNPTAATGKVFADIPANYWAASWIEALYNAGVTSGCGKDNQGRIVYCPSQVVSRDQMAVLLLKAKFGQQYNPPAARGTIFSDVPANHWAGAWIEDLYTKGFTGGCIQSSNYQQRKYCPSDKITRDQLAVFIDRILLSGFSISPTSRAVFPTNIPSPTLKPSAIPTVSKTPTPRACFSFGNFCISSTQCCSRSCVAGRCR